jgi:acetyltransferase
MTPDPVPVDWRLRSITPDDRRELACFYDGLSADSRIRRFHGAASRLPEATATSFCDPDHEHREGIVAEALDPAGRATIVGHICLEPDASHVAEMAVAVSDAWQGHGIGGALLDQAIIWAQAHDIDGLTAWVRCDNAPIIALLRSKGHPVTFGAVDGGEVEARLDLRTAVPRAA